MNVDKNFFQQLTDISFSEFITLKLLGGIYVLAVLVDAIISVYIVVFTFRFFNIFSIVTGLMFFMIFTLILRMLLELAAASIRTAINTTWLVEASRRQLNNNQV